MAEELSPADRASLSAEQGPITMAVGGVLVFEEGPGLDQAAILARLQERLHLIPRYRQRLQAPAPGVNPVWVDDDAFDLGWHVRRTALDGSPGALADLVGREASRRLERGRPLWELTVAEGLPGGRVALLPRMHHALVDGIAAVDVGTVLLDPTPEPLAIQRPDAPWSPRPYDRLEHLGRLARMPLARAGALARDGAQRYLTPSPRRAASDLRAATELLAELARTRPQAPPSAINGALGPNRRYAMHRADLAGLKAAGRAAGGTVNDAILAAVTGMLRRAYPELAADGSRPPVALVPVSVRRSDEEGAGGNRFSTVLVDLPARAPDAAGRVAAVHASMAALKASPAVRAGALLAGAGGWAPPLVSLTLARAMSGVRAFNLVVSNVPGPQLPLYLNGRRLLEAYPVVPLNPANQTLNVGVLSYDGGVCFGLLADRDLAPGVAALAEHLRDSLDEVLALAG